MKRVLSQLSSAAGYRAGLQVLPGKSEPAVPGSLSEPVEPAAQAVRAGQAGPDVHTHHIRKVQVKRVLHSNRAEHRAADRSLTDWAQQAA